MSRGGARALGGLAIALVAVGAYAYSHGGQEILEPSTSSGGSSQSSTALPEKVDAHDLERASTQLDALAVADLSSGDDYDRDEFGQRWKDLDHNGCDQRNDALRASGSDVKAKPGTHDCVVQSATIDDLYTGSTIDFVKGENTVDIDHIVPLSRAWQQGAATWTAEQREQFANTASNLVAVDASANRSKGDKGPEEWMPEAGGCTYSVRWIDVKDDFELSITAGEKKALEHELEGCERTL